MRNIVRNGRIREVAIFSLLLALLALASCNKVEKHAGEKKNTTAEQAIKKTFPSPEEAGVALFEAAKAGDQNALLAIFGPDGNQVLFTGDVTKDRENLQDLVAAYNQMHRWGKIKAGGEVLHVRRGQLSVSDSARSGFFRPVWYFDTAAGKDEILARRIGKDERTAIAACEALSNAEHQYFSQIHDDDKVRQYAQKFSSDPGKQNGLYWPAAKGQSTSPLGLLGDFAKTLAGGEGPKQFRGYYYRILTKQGHKARGGEHEYMVDGRLTRGFGILAYPVEYRNSGIMSFIVGADGMVYQKDLGEQTSDVAATMNEYNPGDGWSRVITPPSPTRRNRG